MQIEDIFPRKMTKEEFDHRERYAPKHTRLKRRRMNEIQRRSRKANRK